MNRPLSLLRTTAPLLLSFLIGLLPGCSKAPEPPRPTRDAALATLRIFTSRLESGDYEGAYALCLKPADPKAARGIKESLIDMVARKDASSDGVSILSRDGQFGQLTPERIGKFRRQFAEFLRTLDTTQLYIVEMVFQTELTTEDHAYAVLFWETDKFQLIAADDFGELAEAATRPHHEGPPLPLDQAVWAKVNREHQEFMAVHVNPAAAAAALRDVLALIRVEDYDHAVRIMKVAPGEPERVIRDVLAKALDSNGLSDAGITTLAETGTFGPIADVSPKTKEAFAASAGVDDVEDIFMLRLSADDTVAQAAFYWDGNHRRLRVIDFHNIGTLGRDFPLSDSERRKRADAALIAHGLTTAPESFPSGVDVRAAASALADVFWLLAAEDYDGASELMRTPRDSESRSATIQRMPRLLENRELSLAGIEVLAETCRFGLLTDILPNRADTYLRAADVDSPDQLYALHSREDGANAEAVLYWNGSRLQVVGFNNVGKLARDLPFTNAKARERAAEVLARHSPAPRFDRTAPHAAAPDAVPHPMPQDPLAGPGLIHPFSSRATELERAVTSYLPAVGAGALALLILMLRRLQHAHATLPKDGAVMRTLQALTGLLGAALFAVFFVYYSQLTKRHFPLVQRLGDSPFNRPALLFVIFAFCMALDLPERLWKNGALHPRYFMMALAMNVVLLLLVFSAASAAGLAYLSNVKHLDGVAVAIWAATCVGTFFAASFVLDFTLEWTTLSTARTYKMIRGKPFLDPSEVENLLKNKRSS